MIHVRTYKTKAKWHIRLNDAGLPIVGYDHFADRDAASNLAPGENVMLFGSMLLTSVSRGRSSVSFNLYGVNEERFHTSASGAEKLFGAVADGRFKLTERTWSIVTRYKHHPDKIESEEFTGPVLTGYWTVAKNGTEISLIPAPKDLLLPSESF